MAPIGVCAAFVGYRLFERVRSRTALGVWMTCCTYVLVTGTLVLPLSDDNSLRQLRYATLRGVAPSNDYRNWDDLIEELRVFRYRHVLTDPVTGYVITAMTKNRTFGFKFHGSGDLLNPNVPAYGSNSFEDYVGWLLVLNLRNGGYSENGSQSGHWPGDALKTSKFYSAQLVEFLENPPPHIQLIWESDSIKLFEIVDK